MTNNISLYVHIPFCVRKCDYCAFFSLSDQGEELKQRYFEALKNQIGFFETEKEVTTVYFGGGTPPVLGRERLIELIRLIKSRYILSKDCEITVEVNPCTVDLGYLKAIKEAGVNRLSVGVQSADDDILRSLGRIHSYADAKRCIRDAREAGFENISADIIFALPGQSTVSFADGLGSVIGLGVDHLSVYSLQLEEGTPLCMRAETLEFPDEEDEEEQYTALCRIASDNGFMHYEISSFAKNRMFSKHNMNYWECGEYFGFGAGAHSFYNGKRFSAECDIEKFIEKSSTSLFAPTDYDSAAVLTEAEAEEERIMLGLRTYQGAVIPKKAYSTAERIANLGYGCFENGVLWLNSKGFRVSNEIIAEVLT